MAAATGLVIIKEFTYRGDANEQWANQYWLTGAPPASDLEWRTLFDELVNLEKGLFSAATKVVGGYAYADNSDTANSVWSVDLEALGETVTGVLTVPFGSEMAGDQAGMIQWQTSRKNSRGKWVYLRKFIHSGAKEASNADLISAACLAAYQNFADILGEGTAMGGRIIRSKAQDEAIVANIASPYVTTRTLKRRGRRP